MYYQHNKSILISHETSNDIKMIKTKLLHLVNSLFKKLKIKFVISHGNLIEYKRNIPIYQDDDLDLRFYFKDSDKIRNNLQFLCSNELIDYEFVNENWIKISLKYTKQEVVICVCVDIVNASYHDNTWIKYDIDFNNLKKIKYLGVCTFSPNDYDTHRILTKEYGKSYMIHDIYSVLSTFTYVFSKFLLDFKFPMEFKEQKIKTKIHKNAISVKYKGNDNILGCILCSMNSINLNLLITSVINNAKIKERIFIFTNSNSRIKIHKYKYSMLYYTDYKNIFMKTLF